jgi:predicted DNA-binding transcriptional regulator YafY
MRRTERLFAIAEYLRARRTGTTAEQLAERFGVTARTMYRDLASLRVAALPLQSDRGRGGGYALDRGYSLPPVNFTAREAAVLVAAARHAIAMRTIPFVETLAGALDKVQGALSRSSQRELVSVLATLQFVGVPAKDVRAEVRKTMERAWFEQRAVRITYVKPDHQTVVRNVRIRSVVMERSETLLNCTDLDLAASKTSASGPSEERQFRLDRVHVAELLPVLSAVEPATKNAGFPEKSLTPARAGP